MSDFPPRAEGTIARSNILQALGWSPDHIAQLLLRLCHVVRWKKNSVECFFELCPSCEPFFFSPQSISCRQVGPLRALGNVPVSSVLASGLTTRNISHLATKFNTSDISLEPPKRRIVHSYSKFGNVPCSPRCLAEGDPWWRREGSVIPEEVLVGKIGVELSHLGLDSKRSLGCSVGPS